MKDNARILDLEKNRVTMRELSGVLTRGKISICFLMMYQSLFTPLPKWRPTEGRSEQAHAKIYNQEEYQWRGKRTKDERVARNTAER